MKKNRIALSLFVLALVSCQSGGESSSALKPTESNNTENKETESKTTSDKENKLEFEPAKTITNLFDYLNTTGRELEKNDGILYDRKYYSYEVGYYTFNTIEKEESGESFDNDTFFSSGTETKTTTYDYKDDVEKSEDSYMCLYQLDGNDYYSILDYASGKEKDKASKEEVQISNRDSYLSKTYLNALDSLYTFYKSKVSKNIIKGVDDITPNVTDKNTVEYHISQGWEEQIGDYKYKYAAIIDLSLDNKGRLTNYSYDFKEYQPSSDENSSDDMLLLSEISDEVSIQFGTKVSYDYLEKIENGEEAIYPLDYFLADYTPVLLSWDGVGTEKTEESNLTFPINMYVEAKATKILPEKALDTKLTITESTNQSVISVSSAGVVKAIGLGNTTLTVESESGIAKNIDVTVVSPALEEIIAKTYSTYHYKGDTDTLYIYKTPSNSLEEIEVVSLTEDIIEIVKDKDGDYALHNIGLGDGKVEVRSKVNPSVKCTVSYLVQEKKTADEVKANVVGKWNGDLPNTNGTKMIKDAATVIYNDDGTGSFTLNSSETGYTFEVGKAYSFTYTFLEQGRYTDRPVSLTMSTITLDHGSVVWTYSANAADFYYTGENANIIFATGNSEEYGAMVQLSARRVA